MTARCWTRCINVVIGKEAIFGFERTTGVVASIKGESQSKSGELAQALSGGKKIVVCTIQTFPFALKAVLSAEEIAALNDGGELSTEDLLTANMGNRAAQDGQSGISYVAFTATPKAKTIELFGRRPQPD